MTILVGKLKFKALSSISTFFPQVNINPAYQPSELKYCLNKVGVKAIVSSESFKTQDYYKMMAEIMPELPSGEKMVIFNRMII